MKIKVQLLQESDHPLLKGKKVDDVFGLEYADEDGNPVIPDLVNLGLILSLNEHMA